MVLDGLLSPQECDELRRRMEEIVEEMDVPEHCRTVFSTYHDEQTKTQVTEFTTRWPLGASCGTTSAFIPSYFSLSRAFLFSDFKMQVGFLAHAVML